MVQELLVMRCDDKPNNGASVGQHVKHSGHRNASCCTVVSDSGPHCRLRAASLLPVQARVPCRQTWPAACKGSPCRYHHRLHGWARRAGGTRCTRLALCLQRSGLHGLPRTPRFLPFLLPVSP